MLVQQQFSEDLLRRTLEFWQPYSKKPLTVADAEEILTNVGNLLDLLERYAREEQMGKATEERSQHMPPSVRGPKKTCSLRKWYLQRGISVPKSSA